MSGALHLGGVMTSFPTMMPPSKPLIPSGAERNRSQNKKSLVRNVACTVFSPTAVNSRL